MALEQVEIINELKNKKQIEWDGQEAQFSLPLFNFPTAAVKEVIFLCQIKRFILLMQIFN